MSFPVEDRFNLFCTADLSQEECFEQLYQAFSTTQLNSFLSFTTIRVRLIVPGNDGLGASAMRAEDQLYEMLYGMQDIEISARLLFTFPLTFVINNLHIFSLYFIYRAILD